MDSFGVFLVHQAAAPIQCEMEIKWRLLANTNERNRWSGVRLECSSSSSFSVQGNVFRRIDALLGEFRVGGGVHDSYTFQCGLVGSFTSPGIDTR